MLIRELTVLHYNLEGLDKFLRSSEADLHVVFERTSVLRSCTATCEEKLNALSEKLRAKESSKFGGLGIQMNKILWPLSEEAHQKTIEDLRAFSLWLQFALSIDGCSLLTLTSDNVLRVFEKQLETFNSLKILEDKMDRLHQSAVTQLRIAEDSQKAEARAFRAALLDWISTMDYSHKHNSILSTRVEGTGKWILSHPDYLEWRNGLAGSNFLWFPGSPGSGKTYLASVVPL